MTNQEIIKQLKDLRESCRLRSESMLVGEVWCKDVEALDAVIEIMDSLTPEEENPVPDSFKQATMDRFMWTE